jgi:RNA polymerase sigma-70 factor (ECF subfamily)
LHTERGLKKFPLLERKNAASLLIVRDESGINVRHASTGKGKAEQFEAIFLPYLDSAYNLARWLTRNEHDAQDVVQESYLRALEAFGGFHTERDGRPWLLRIVRNTCYTWLRRNRPAELVTGAVDVAEEAIDSGANIESAMIEKANSELIRRALEEIEVEYREVLILREWEGQSYKEIAQIVDVPLGTVMSRLSRGRRELQRRLCPATETNK